MRSNLAFMLTTGPQNSSPTAAGPGAVRLSSTCNCGATVNSGYCGKCVLEAALEADGCLHGGACWGCDDAQNVADRVYNGCMSGLTPPPPPPPTPTATPLVCGGVPEIVRGNPLPLSRRFGALSATPVAAASGSCEIKFLDPVPFQDDSNSQSLMNGNAITTNYTVLAAQGRPVWGISADNAARVVLRFRANDAKELLTVTLSDTDNGYAPATFANLGGLYSIGGNENDAQGQRQLDVVPYADSGGTLWGFAVYRAPPDFARVDRQGSALAIDTVNNTTRPVQFSVATNKSDLYPNYAPYGVLNIVRPLVVGVHGIFDSGHLFDHFLYTKDGQPDPTGQPDPRFVFKTVSYDRSLAGQISFTGTVLYGSSGYPGASNALATKANENQLGLAYNAPRVHDRIRQEIDRFRTLGLGGATPLAAVQADVVAHSMGGTIVRTLETPPTFLGASSFSRGQIHKLITVGTPHLGSPIPSDIVAQPLVVAKGLILSGRLALGPSVVFKNGETCNGQACSGGFFDMQGNGVNRVGLSPALTFLQDQTNAQVPTHLVAGMIDASNFYGSPGAAVSQIGRAAGMGRGG